MEGRRVPVLATAIVAMAIAAMIALGIWQLRRADEKNALIARYQAASALAPTAFPAVPANDDLLFRRASGFCLSVTGMTARAGSNRAGDTGYRHIATCRTGGGEGPGMAVDIGWSRSPANPEWAGGAVSGVIGSDPTHRLVLVADTAAAGLEPSAKPSTDSIPNNHLGYAIQWFCFAAAAAVIYGLALRRRQVASGANQG